MDTARTTIPTPAALASRASAAAPVPAAGYDRAVWERAVLASDLSHDGRTVALVLAHHADADGHLPAGGAQSARHLASLTRRDARKVRLALNELELQHFIRRPSIHTWTNTERVRPVDLVLPAAVRRQR